MLHLVGITTINITTISITTNNIITHQHHHSQHHCHHHHHQQHHHHNQDLDIDRKIKATWNHPATPDGHSASMEGAIIA